MFALLAIGLLAAGVAGFFMSGAVAQAHPDGPDGNHPNVPNPPAPTNVGQHLVYDTGIVLKWKPPQERQTPEANKIQYYFIEIKRDSATEWAEDDYTTRSANVPVRNGFHIGGFHDLEQNTVYDLRISSCIHYEPHGSEYHCSGTVAVNDVRTAIAVPSPPRNLKVTAGEFVDGLNQNQARLTWDPPATDGGRSISRYEVYFKLRGATEYRAQDIILCRDGPTLTHCVVHNRNLDPTKEYDFRVWAVNQTTDENWRYEEVTLPRRPRRPGA